MTRNIRFGTLPSNPAVGGSVDRAGVGCDEAEGRGVEVDLVVERTVELRELDIGDVVAVHEFNAREC